jgi:hypothetical protein
MTATATGMIERGNETIMTTEITIKSIAATNKMNPRLSLFVASAIFSWRYAHSACLDKMQSPEAIGPPGYLAFGNLWFVNLVFLTSKLA